MDVVKVSLANKTAKISPPPGMWRPLTPRIMLPGSDLFTEGDRAMQAARKFIPLEDDDDDEDYDTNIKDSFPCGISGCSQMFTSLLSYENHYKTVHQNTCSTCHRTFPSAFLLDIHIEESHDTMFSILVAKKNMYRCLVESCSEKMSGPKERRQHMIKTHHYPANYRFHRLYSPHCRQRKKSESNAATNGMEVTDVEQPANMENEDCPDSAMPTDPQTSSSTEIPSLGQLTRSSGNDKENTAVSVNKYGQGNEGEETMEVNTGERDGGCQRVFAYKVPENFSFGRGIGRSFPGANGKKKKKKKKGHHWHQCMNDDSEGDTTTTNIENVDMQDMCNALNEVLE